MSGEFVAFLAGLGIYILFYFFGYAPSKPGLRKMKPDMPLGIGLVGIGIVLFFFALLVAYSTDTQLRSLEKNRDLPEFIRLAYWFSIVLATIGACEVLRAFVSRDRQRRFGSFRISDRRSEDKVK